MKQQPYEIDLANAKRHRDKDNSLTNPFYDCQAQILEGAPFDKPLPREVRTGELPQGILHRQ